MYPVAVLAGGLGTRMAKRTGPRLPKALLEVAGRPFIDFKLGQLAGEGATRVVMLLGHGAGAIAEHVAKVCQAFGMTTLGISRTPRKLDGFDAIYPREKLLEAAAQADFLLALVPYTKENDKIVNAAVFDVMKPTAYLINIARGGVVDETALMKALREGKIAGAGLDVFEEAPLPSSSPLWDMDNVFITPFIGGRSDRYEESIMSIIKPNLRSFLGGRDDEMINRVAL